jgi:ribose transport system permease protein
MVKPTALNRIAGRKTSYNRPTVGIVIFLVLLVIYGANTKSFFTLFQFKDIILNSTLAVALAAVGEGIVIISGGFDMSVGATVILLNVILVSTHTNAAFGGIFVWSLICLGIGVLVGLFNGFLVAIVRLPSIIATVATMFILQGIALLVMPVPTGSVPKGYINFWTGAIGGIIPISLICFLLLIVILIALKNSSFGTNLFAIGSDEYAAYLNGIQVTRTKLAAYALAGFFYGLAGLYVTAQMGSGDPTLASSLMLSVFAAVVVGGIRIGGGKGSFIGSIIGAGIMNLTVMTLFVMGVSSYWGPISNGIILIGAVIMTSLWNR